MISTRATNRESSLPSTARVMWLIARRATLESLRDRTTQLVSVLFSLVFPLVFVVVVIVPIAAQATTTSGRTALGTTMAVFLLTVGLLPTSGSVGIAAGQFAGEKEQGNLAPLLATPASNTAIFGGKVIGAVLPTLAYSAIAIVTYGIEITVTLGLSKLRLVPIGLALSMIALVPAVSTFGAVVASLISSRVRTYNAAQQISSLILIPVLLVFVIVAINIQTWEPFGPVAAVLVSLAIDAVLILLGAATWRREEVLARR